MGIGSKRQVALEAFFSIVFISDIVVGSKCVNLVVGVTSKVSRGQWISSVEVAKVAREVLMVAILEIKKSLKICAIDLGSEY